MRAAIYNQSELNNIYYLCMLNRNSVPMRIRIYILCGRFRVTYTRY